MENGDHKTPSELFTEKHKKLREDGEEWMKETATSCMVVTTLIATVAFAAAFTTPGGNNDTGVPIFLKDGWFTVFFISDAGAMFSSTTSIMMFLSILTARYAEDDFLFSLPAKLMVGLIHSLLQLFAWSFLTDLLFGLQGRKERDIAETCCCSCLASNHFICSAKL
ncbi:Ankyrin repeat family protein [Abeliophyllum distichum]|uniref:Ankyrin repeat family protein n=1 Tax=Abeliophyllum distichum TaxID=126358 RepID=A0ABD1UIK3_9LAMI